MMARSQLWWVLMSMLIMSSHLHALTADSVFLKPKQVFTPEITFEQTKVRVQWGIADGYYLYRHGFEARIEADTQQEARQTSSVIPLNIEPGTIKFDENFDKNVEVYRQSVAVTFDLASWVSQSGTGDGVLTLSSQGCADEGFCYPPTDYPFEIQTGAGEIQRITLIQQVPAKSGFLASLAGTSSLSPSVSALTPSSVTSASGSSQSEAESQSKKPPPIISQKAPALSFGEFMVTLVSAFFGGLLLNLMPCVFPVLSLKAMSFASGQQKIHGWMYTFGVVGSFLAVAGIISVAKAFGAGLGWGFQLQEPLFVIAMMMLFFIMALSLSGFFELGRSIMGVGQSLTEGKGLSASFFTGVLAVVVASPCTAPFMATAIGVAFTQSLLITLCIFAALGLGMALPFLVLSHSSRLAKKLPKPGLWMETVKQGLAFPLYLSVIWLLWVLVNQTNVSVVFIALMSLLSIIFITWLMKIKAQKTTAKLLKNTLIVLSIVPFIWLFKSVLYAENTVSNSESNVGSKWSQTLSLQKLDALRADGKPVFVDLTADWCLTCKVNAKVALTDDIKNQLQEAEITMLVGDWTKANPEVEGLLQRYNRSGIPLYLMYPKGPGQAQILPQLLTQGIVEKAIEQAIMQEHKY